MTPTNLDTSPLKHCRSPYAYQRRKTRVVMVGNVGVGGDNPIRVQSMTTTDTMDVKATIEQAALMAKVGCEIIRITAPTVEDARRLGQIKEGLLKRGIDNPLVADIHFQPLAAIEAAEHVEKVRINPGNFCDNKRFAVKEYTDNEYDAELLRIEERFTPLVEKMKRLKRALRIGTNHGSLSDRIMNRYGDSPLGMVESALEFVRICEKNGFHDIILSMKSSNPKVMTQAYRLLAARMAANGQDYPFHLGVTEAGDGEDGRIKSAIGIGGLMADGIGDTIRVSLTEPPEAEVPVCYELAEPFQARKAQSAPAQAPEYCADPFNYVRRKSRAFPIGPFLTGGHQLVRVVSPIDAAADASSIMAVLEEQLKKAQGADPEILEWTLKTPQDLARLREVRKALATETSRLAFLGRVEGDLALDAADLDLVCFPRGVPAGFAGKPVLVEAESAEQALAQSGENRLLSLRGSDPVLLLQEYRKLASLAPNVPILINAPQELLACSILVGGLLCDGIGDAIKISGSLPLKRNLEQAYNILQGAGVRITKTEFVSCPSCGRTLFDLQTTTERIKAKTGHLKGVKIAIMGCIVNGPGEMADADFGYVGGAPGKINLYVGKDCVSKGIPTELADQALIDLIKANGKWSAAA
jgi:(E)-4-hydroxy-3-methylbut-2-enyl-diphosphate synthase